MAYRVRIVAVGKIRQKFYKEAISEYIKRLSPFCRILIDEVEEVGDPLKEGDNILRIVKDNNCFIALDERGELLTSLDFSKRLEKFFLKGEEPVFALGGVRGFSEQIRKSALEVWALSKLTFTHELARLILIEQIYRAFKIMRGEPYHY
ncbi:MAG: 23S rRNA (pseudouridine(1915)-N(3))-methyltransferase RlmH [Synergistetes bacterium]|nr:23S rRNA (pseudouridine(1915)-N(3))-methyltransferase RlmH [Synergistota bacterium]MCX8127370.1 23S rRNA (pseudouridine(1915)-N(3))-methyltransferase RlmH [Synergistota bacterium]MDW8192234.1 23S rRNA (pseudouridine(1915)-N(3))-methyltransferase RlmH [Synergistota bacterium]